MILVAAVGYRIKEWNDVNCRVDCETRRGPDYTTTVSRRLKNKILQQMKFATSSAPKQQKSTR